MSQGLQLLASALAVRSRHAVTRLLSEFFIGDERPAFEFVTGFYRQYGELPSMEVCAENGYRLIPATQPFDYYVDRCRRRAIANSWQPEHQNFARAAGVNDIEGGRETLERMLRTYRSFDTAQSLITLEQSAQALLEDYAEASAHEGLRGVTWGWEFVDNLTLGQTPGDVSVIAARPGVGKSWTMAFLAVAAWQAGHSVLFVTMEMTVLQMARRIFGLLCGVNPTVMRRGMADQWTEPLFRNIVDIAGAGAPFHFVSGDINKSVIDVENFALETAPDIVFIDAAYLLDPADKKGRYSKHEVLQEVLKGIKQIAMNRNIPVTISVQYNREAKKTGTGLENISGSDYIGQLASNVLSISEGVSPYQRTRRRYKMVKVRDAEGGREFDTHFLLNPPNLNFIDAVEEQDATAPNPNMQNLQQGMI